MCGIGASSADAHSSVSKVRQEYYHADGYIKAIGKNARRTIYHPNPRIKHRWQRDLRYLMRVRHRAYLILHPPAPAPAVDDCLSRLIDRESGGNVHATNPYSGAYGIPQALPAEKMASAGADWHDNPATQIRWMIGYIADRYGSACAALSYQISHGSY